MTAYHAIPVNVDGTMLRFINTDAPPSGFSVEKRQQLVFDHIDTSLSMVKPRCDGQETPGSNPPHRRNGMPLSPPSPYPNLAPPTQTELLAVEFSTALAAIRLETDLGLAEMTTLLAAGMEG